MAKFISGKLQRPSRQVWLALIAVFIMAGAALFIYRNILFPSAGIEGWHPWGSDTLGHVFRAEYLRSSLQQGKLPPAIYPDWYMGIQLLRYYPPLPYYLLVMVTLALSDPIAAASWFVVIAAWLGSLGWLLYRRWLGWPLALAGGICYLALPDNLRVALSEGNLPRALASALLPYLFYFMLRAISSGEKPRHFLAMAFFMGLIVFSHAMMAAIYAVCCIFTFSLLLICRAVSARRFFSGFLYICLGLLTTSFWLLPSLTGGITELDPSAMAEAITAVPLAVYFNPALRSGNPEVVYAGAALLTAAIASLLLMRTAGRIQPHPAGLILTGLGGIALTLPGILEIFNALPGHNLLWPVRFIGVASFCLLFGLLWWLRTLSHMRWLALPVMLLIAVDSSGSYALIHLRQEKPDLKTISAALSELPGWREATLDFSRIGSEAAYELSADCKREQIFGWAYQGAYTAKTVARLNDSLETGRLAYLVDRMNLYGVDDVIRLNNIDADGRITKALTEGGFDRIYRGIESDLFHRDGGPRAVVADWQALGVGRTASPYAYIFPQIILGTSHYVDDYSLQELQRFPILILSGFAWHHREKAESLVQQVAEAGTQVVVDLTGTPDDPLARIPHFLGVWGERVMLDALPVEVTSEKGDYQLLSFGSQDQLWFTHTPQGVDRYLFTSQFLEEPAAVAGVRIFGRAEIAFVGFNLAYHALQTGDAAAEEILNDVIGLRAGQLNSFSFIPLLDYQAGPDGYKFGYNNDTDEILFIPIAALEGVKVLVDNLPTETSSYERLLAFTAPAGRHQVQVTIQPGWIERVGWLLSGVAGLIWITLIIQKRIW
jgi:uncharacterized membrane protein